MKSFKGKAPKGTRPLKINNPDEAGSTLIETVIALIIMLIAGLGVASIFLYTSRFNAGGNERAVAIALAQEQMEMKRAVPFKDLIMGETTETIVAGPTGATRSYTIVTTITNNNVLAEYWLENAKTKTLSPEIEQKEIRVRVTPVLISSRWSSGTVDLVTLRSPIEVGPHTEPNPTPKVGK